jgi:hypothetical protein
MLYMLEPDNFGHLYADLWVERGCNMIFVIELFPVPRGFVNVNVLYEVIVGHLIEILSL